MDNLNWSEGNSNDFDPIQASTQASLVADSETKAFYDWYNKLDTSLSSETKDYLVEHWLNERSAQKSFDRELEASSTQYQRAVQDLQAAGLNPFLAIQGLSGSSASSSPSTVSGGHYTAAANSLRSANASVASKALTSVLSALAMIAVAIIAA